ncbi:MAG TPA: hypothetical protein VHS06_04050, partial [Chloroflexota bacterium]|nr:hypothetical protein [Chloroflexota bacterium]
MFRKVLLVLVLGIATLAAVGFVQRTNGLKVAAPVHGQDVGGKIAYARAGALWIYSGGSAQQLTKGPQDRQDKRDTSPSFSPDGTEIVYARTDEGFSDLYKLSLNNPAKTLALTSYRPDVQTGAQGYNKQALWALQPAWSPDGSKIAYLNDKGTEYPGLYLMTAEGDNPHRIDFLDHSTQAVERPAWSPDGTKIAVANYVTNGAKGQIWVLNLDTGRWTAVTNAPDGAYDPAWSPDGEWLAFTMRSGKANDIYVAPTDATKWTTEYPTPSQLTTDGNSRSPAWSPDGKRLAFIGLQDNSFNLYAASVGQGTGGAPTLSSIQRLIQGGNL